MRFRSMVLVVSLFAASALAAGVDREKPPHRSTHVQPWAWSLDERLEVRFDPDSIRDRSLANDDRNRAIMTDVGYDARVIEANAPRNNPKTYHAIDGRRDPALFTPTEVFDALLFAFYDEPRTRLDIRDAVRREVATLHMSEDDFWAELESIAGKYADASQRHVHGHPFTSPRESDEFCAMRLDALNAARARFGQPAFDRLLYVAIAPKMTKVGGETSSNRGPQRDPATELRRQEGGCR